MKQRSKIRGKAVETRRGKAAKPNPPSRSKSTQKHRFTETSQEADIGRLTRERDEAVEREKASAEVLRVISSSPSDLEPVFQTILENAARICGAALGLLWLVEGDGFRVVALSGARPELIALLRREPTIHPGPRAPLPRVAATKQLLHIADMAEDGSYKEDDPTVVNFVKIAGARTVLIVPLVKDGEFIGALSIYRSAVHLFAEKQIDFLKNFAAQAVIAIENARLLSELRQRTADLTESLEQQTATAEVLRVISSSPGELAPVFNAILDNATRICDAKFGNLLLFAGNDMRVVAMHNAPIEHEDIRRREPVINLRRSICGPVVRTKKIFSILDMAAEEPYASSALARAGGGRTALAVPMLQEDQLVGAITIFRQEVRAFSERQIALVQNFAAEAVIAIENTRLLNELRARTDDLTESLEQQTATSEVLGVISSSRGDLGPIFETILSNAIRMCAAQRGDLLLFDGESMRVAAMHNAPRERQEMRRRDPVIPLHQSILNPLVKTKKVICIPDITAEEPYASSPLAKMGYARTALGVPMLGENELVGAITIYRQEVRPFTDKQIALVQNFAAQAVIAIDNVRLLIKLRERTDELEKSYGTVREQASQLEAQSRELMQLNQQLEQRVTEQVGEIERMGRLRRFLPPQVADLIVASGAEKQLESHRREITALFCDLRGFTGFSESSDPEDVMALLRDYHTAIGEIIIKYSGTLERYAGDGVMVIFNDPVPAENPALQAVLMALDMRAAIGGLIERWRDLGHDLGFGIGIAHGFATLGTIGFEGRRDYAAIGTVSNVASRLCDEAKPGQILISPRVRQTVEKAVTVEPVGEFVLKGIRRPMMAYNVLDGTVSKELN